MARKLYGYDSALYGLYETGPIGTPAAGGFRPLPFTSHALAGTVALEPSDLLGQGRDPLDPEEGAETAAGDIGVPLDLRHTGWWLTLLMGAPVTTDAQAYGAVAFAANPAPGDTVTLNGTVFAFVAGAPTEAGEVERGGTLLQSLANLALAANASVLPAVAAATYSVADGARLDVLFDAPGAAGAAYTLAASAATVSGPTLARTYRHEWRSGRDEEDLRRATLVLKPRTGAANAARQVSVFANSLRLPLAATGKAGATIGCIAHSDAELAAPDLGVPPPHWAFARFAQTRAQVTSGGEPLAEVVGGELTYSNAMAAVPTLGAGGRMGDVDLGVAEVTGSLTARWRDGVLRAAAAGRTPVEVTITYPMHPGARLDLVQSRLWLPRPSRQIGGPGGVEATYQFRAARRDAGTPAPALAAVLLNDVGGYA